MSEAMPETMPEEEIVVPQMIGFDNLTKIMVAYLKIGGENAEKSSPEVAQVSGVGRTSVALNNKFFVSMGLLESKNGAYKLTKAGAEYTRALDWGRLDEAKAVLRRAIKDRPLVTKTLSYVDLNKPIRMEDLTARIASFAKVENEPRFATGIRAFVEMLILSGLLVEGKDGSVTPVEKEMPVEPALKTPPTPSIPSEKERQVDFRPPINITINVDSSVDVEKLKAAVKAIREAFATE